MESWLKPLRLLSLGVLFALGCVSAEDRLQEGVQLQNQGQYMSAVYRYADAVERDGSLAEARQRLVAAGDTAMGMALADAAALEERGDPVAAAQQYQAIDRMLARIRSVGERLYPHAGYEADRRALFDRAIEWRMVQGDDALAEGRWADARQAYINARSDFGPSRDQTEASLDAETDLLLEWARIELADGRPRTAYELAAQAADVRSSTPRDVVLTVRDLQAEALERGTVVVAVPPLTARGGVREYLGPEFEIQLDDDLVLDHWTNPPPFVRMADHAAMRSELRGLLRGISQSPLIVGRALELVGADLAAMIELSEIEVLEEEVERTTRESMLRDGSAGPSREPRPTTYDVVEGTMVYRLVADVVLVDHQGREVTRFRAEGRSSGPFRRGEFEGNHERLQLTEAEAALFDPALLGEQVARIEAALMEEVAVAIAAGTYETVMERIP